MLILLLVKLDNDIFMYIPQNKLWSNRTLFENLSYKSNIKV